METDRNLLFGVLALQLELLDSRQFSDACCLWAARKDESLADLLVGRGWLTRSDRAEVERLMERKLRRNGGDARASLDDLWAGFLREALDEVDDPEVRKSIGDLVGPTQSDSRGAAVATAPNDQARYTVIRLHARGGIGQVWLAQDRSLERDVALKELQSGQGDSPVARARFLREAKITGVLEHPGIVPVYELVYRPETSAGSAVSTASGTPTASAGSGAFYTMRFIRGRSLQEAARDHHRKEAEGRAEPMALRALVESFYSVCNTMAYAHSRGVVHRDLKGSNVVVGDYGEVFVLDWGLAKVVPGPAAFATMTWMDGQDGVEPAGPIHEGKVELTLQGQVLGTPGFMAPEQAESRLDLVNQRTDIYGLGALLYEILTGQAPFHGKSAFEVLRRIVHEPVRPPRSLAAGTPPALEAICLKAMAKRPEDRYDSVSTLARDLRCWLADEPVSVCREPLLQRVGRWVRRHRTLVAAAAVLLVTSLIALSVSTVMIGMERDAKAQAYRAADAQRKKAEANFQTAVAAVNKYLTAVGDSDELKARGLEPLREKLLASAREFFEQFLREQGADPSRRDDLGEATYRLAEIHELLGNSQTAEELYKKARDLLDTPADGPPETRKRRDLLANVTNGLGNVQFSSGRTDEAEGNWRSSLALRERLVLEEPAQSSHLVNMASIHNNLGQLYHERRDWEAAEKANRSAIAIYSNLARDAADTLQIEHRLAVCLFNFCNLEIARKRSKEAVEYIDRAIENWRKISAKYPTNPVYQGGLANALNSRGALELALGRTREAKATWDEARKLLEVLEHDHPLVPQYQEILANVLSNIALPGQSTREEAEQARNRGMNLLERLVHDHPEVVAYRHSHAAAQMNAAVRLHLLGRFKDALPHFDAAIATLERLLPRFKSVKENLRKCYQDRGQTLSLLGRHEEAVRDFDRAIELDDQNLVVLPIFRAVILARTGDHAGAASAAEKLEGKARPTLEEYGNLACIYSLASAAARKDENVAGVDAEGLSLADRYANRALDMLEKARDKGILAGPAMAEQLAADPDWEAIKRHPRFQNLLETLRMSTKPGHADSENMK